MDSSVLFCLIISILLCVVLPIILAIIMIVKYKADWKAFVIGAIVFTVMQPLIRIPILGLLANMPWYILFAKANVILYIILLAFSAGLFENAGRFIGLKLYPKKSLNWKNVFLFGLGHGFAEVVYLVGITYIAMAVSIIAGQNIPLSAPPYVLLIAGLERMFAIAIHIGLTMLVAYSVKYKKIHYLLYAILAHTLVDGLMLILQQLGVKTDIWITEGYVAVCAVLATIITVKFRAVLNKDLMVTDTNDGGI